MNALRFKRLIFRTVLFIAAIAAICLALVKVSAALYDSDLEKSINKDISRMREDYLLVKQMEVTQ